MYMANAPTKRHNAGEKRHGECCACTRSWRHSCSSSRPRLMCCHGINRLGGGSSALAALGLLTCGPWVSDFLYIPRTHHRKLVHAWCLQESELSTSLLSKKRLPEAGMKAKYANIDKELYQWLLEQQESGNQVSRCATIRACGTREREGLPPQSGSYCSCHGMLATFNVNGRVSLVTSLCFSKLM